MRAKPNSSTTGPDISVIIPCENAADTRNLLCCLQELSDGIAEILLLERQPAQSPSLSDKRSALGLPVKTLPAEAQLELKTALRNGLAAAKGNAILFLRPDDTITSRGIEQARTLIREQAVDMVDLSGTWNTLFTKTSIQTGKDTLTPFAKKANAGVDLFANIMTRELAAQALAPKFPQDRYDEVAALMTAHVAAFHTSKFSGVDAPGMTKGKAGMWESVEGRIMGAAALLNDFISYCSTCGWPPTACDAYADSLVTLLRQDVRSFMQDAEHDAQSLLAFGTEAEALRALLTGHPTMQRAVERRNAMLHKQLLKREGRHMALWAFTLRQKLAGHIQAVKHALAGL